MDFVGDAKFDFQLWSKYEKMPSQQPYFITNTHLPLTLTQDKQIKIQYSAFECGLPFTVPEQIV